MSTKVPGTIWQGLVRKEQVRLVISKGGSISVQCVLSTVTPWNYNKVPVTGEYHELISLSKGSLLNDLIGALCKV